jgi:hypothetical protein
MHSIPSILPSLYDWGFWVPFFFRLFLAYQLFSEAQRLFSGKTPELITYDSATSPSAQKTLAWILVVVGGLLLVGLGVQAVAVFTACAYLFQFVQLLKAPTKNTPLRHLILLSALVSFSLLFLGPGPYAVDLPL